MRWRLPMAMSRADYALYIDYAMVAALTEAERGLIGRHQPSCFAFRLILSGRDDYALIAVISATSPI